MILHDKIEESDSVPLYHPLSLPQAEQALLPQPLLLHQVLQHTHSAQWLFAELLFFSISDTGVPKPGAVSRFGVTRAGLPSPCWLTHSWLCSQTVHLTDELYICFISGSGVWT